MILASCFYCRTKVGELKPDAPTGMKTVTPGVDLSQCPPPPVPQPKHPKPAPETIQPEGKPKPKPTPKPKAAQEKTPLQLAKKEMSIASLNITECKSWKAKLGADPNMSSTYLPCNMSMQNMSVENYVALVCVVLL